MGGEAKAASTSMEAALNIPLITGRILKQVDFKDKKNIRLVSQLWRDCTLEHWRKTAAIQIAIPYQMSTYKEATSGMVSIEDFEEMMEEPHKSRWTLFRIQEQPFTSFILHGGTFYLPKRGEGIKIKASWAYSSIESDAERFKKIENDVSEVYQFLDKYGSTMKYLQLDEVEFAPGSFIPGMEWIVKKGCPQLEAFSLHVPSIYSPLEQSEEASHLSSSGKSGPFLEDGGTNLITFEASNVILCYPEQSLQVDNIWIQILRTMPNIKVLKYHSSMYNGYFPVESALSVPFANGKCLQLEELDIECCVDRIDNLSRYIEQCQQAPFKKLRVNLDFCHYPPEYLWPFEERSPHLHQFFASHGNNLTTLAIKLPFTMTCDCCGYGRDQRINNWIHHLTGYNFINLTHLFVSYAVYYENQDFGCGPLRFDFKVFKAMPKLQVFRCYSPDYFGSLVIPPESLEAPWRREDRALPEVYHKPTELKDLKEFSCSANHFNLDSLRIVLGWMEGVKKVALNLDDKTFPLVCEMLPNLEELSLVQYTTLTPVEKETGEIWCDEKASERREKEWRSRDEKRRFGEVHANKMEMDRKKKERKERMNNKAKLEKKKEKEEEDRKRWEVEREEKEWIGKQEKEGEEWNFVSYRKEKKEKKVTVKKKVKKVTVNNGVSKDTILAELRRRPSLKVYNTNRSALNRVESDFPNFGEVQLIQYKIGGESEF